MLNLFIYTISIFFCWYYSSIGCIKAFKLELNYYKILVGP